MIRKNILLLSCLFAMHAIVFAQTNNEKKDSKKDVPKLGIGIKAGLNFANVTNASSINAANKTGFMAGLFLAPPSHGILGFRTEAIFSRQGYNYQTAENTGAVSLNYILLPQLTTINITKFVQLQLGGQVAFLLNAKADSSGTSISTTGYGKIIDYYNKIDYGFAAGVELHPVKFLALGARYNISLNNLYKPSTTYTGTPDFLPSAGSVNFKNNVVQVFAGIIF